MTQSENNDNRHKHHIYLLQKHDSTSLKGTEGSVLFCCSQDSTATEGHTGLNCNSSCSMKPLLSWSKILKTLSISEGLFLDKPTALKNI